MICCTTCLDLQELVMNVKMCCDKCEDIVKEGVWDLPGVMDVKTDRVHSKVLVVGKVEKSKVLKKAKKVDKKADFVEMKKTEEKKKPEEKKPEEKKDAAGSSNKAITNVIYHPPPYPYYPYYPPTFMPPVPNFALRDSDSPYTPTQSYSPYYNPESDYGYYNYPHNSHYY
jgi:copper chaperone CopZ